MHATQWIHEVTQQYIPSPRGPKEDLERQVELVLKRLREQVKKVSSRRVTAGASRNQEG